MDGADGEGGADASGETLEDMLNGPEAAFARETAGPLVDEILELDPRLASIDRPALLALCVYHIAMADMAIRQNLAEAGLRRLEASREQTEIMRKQAELMDEQTALLKGQGAMMERQRATIERQAKLLAACGMEADQSAPRLLN